MTMTKQSRGGEGVRLLIALIVLVGGGGLVAAVWFIPTPRDPSGLIMALVAVISGVLGHYFGSRGVERAQIIAEGEGELERVASSKVEGLTILASEYERVVVAAGRDPILRERLKKALGEREVEDP